MDFPLVMASRSAGHRTRKLVMRLLEPIGLHPGQEVVLIELRSRGELNQTELAAALEVEPPTCTSIVGNLLRAGLVTRTARGRENRIALTAAGEATADQALQVYAAMEAALSAGLPTAERDAALAALQQVAAAAAAALAAPTP
ncbi:MAG: MarR family transcriptional regulator [Actinomycetales bacterium]|nr:MarR family transcriptional regulator [Actinomycetales bacterium]